MTKTELNQTLGVSYFYWAKKFDTHAHVTVPGNKVVCGKLAALLGNNYASNLTDVCPMCEKMLMSEFKVHDYEQSVKVFIKEFDGQEFDDVIFYGNPEYVDNGIGSYEYWGSKETHHQWEWECEDVEWDHSLYSEEENKIIENYIEEAVEKLIAKAKKEENEY